MAIGLFYGKDRINSSGINFNEWKANTNYKINQYVTHNYCLFKSLAEHTSSNDFENDLSNWELVIGGNSFKLVKWLDNTEYKTDDYVVYDYKIYKCLVGHTSSTNFNDDLILGNWELYVGGSNEIIPNWETDHDYIVGDRVKHNNYVYECIIEHHSDLVEFDNDKDNWIIELDKYFSLSQNQYDQMVTDGLIDDTNKHLYIIEDSEEESKLPEDEEPYTITADNGTTRLFACGYPMLIDSNTNHQYDSTASEDSVVFLYKFEAEPKMIVMDKTQASNTTVFGGYGDKNIGVTRVLPQTSLVAKNVALRGIVGGSFFQGIIGKAEIEIENCEIKNIVGGGWAGESVEGLNAEKNIVTEANVKVTNTTGIQLLFGGSQGFGVVDKVNIEVNGASEIHWLTTGGSNGYTRQGTVTINGGQIKVVQGVNRGIVDESNIILNNGTVENFYVGGEIGDATVTGKIFKGHVELNFGTIDNFYRGNSELVEFANVEGTIMDTIVTNGDISMLRKIINTEGKADYELSFTDQKDINLQHNLKCKYPMIRVFDTNDNELYMDIEYYSDNLTILHSEIEISGKVIVNKL